jgi:hypothetical protein
MFDRIMQMTEAELDDLAKLHKLDLPEEFCCSNPRHGKAEYITAQLGIEDLREGEPSAARALDEEVLEYARAHNLSYAEALRTLIQDRNFLERWQVVYPFAHGVDRNRSEPDDDDDRDAGRAIDKAAREIQREHPGMSYESALGRARKRNPALARRYAASFPGGVSVRSKA